MWVYERRKVVTITTLHSHTTTALCYIDNYSTYLLHSHYHKLIWSRQFNTTNISITTTSISITTTSIATTTVLQEQLANTHIATSCYILPVYQNTIYQWTARLTGWTSPLSHSTDILLPNTTAVCKGLSKLTHNHFFICFLLKFLHFSMISYIWRSLHQLSYYWALLL